MKKDKFHEDGSAVAHMGWGVGPLFSKTVVLQKERWSYKKNSDPSKTTLAIVLKAAHKVSGEKCYQVKWINVFFMHL